MSQKISYPFHDPISFLCVKPEYIEAENMPSLVIVQFMESILTLSLTIMLTGTSNPNKEKYTKKELLSLTATKLLRRRS